jgi:hypothetical protein
MTLLFCSNCGEQLIDLTESVPGEFPPHDLNRCKTIERAFSLEATGKGTKLSRLIVDRIFWIRAHSDPRARRDHRAFLDHYVELFRQEERL